jgi:hypothetical protein
LECGFASDGEAPRQRPLASGRATQAAIGIGTSGRAGTA